MEAVCTDSLLIQKCLKITNDFYILVESVLTKNMIARFLKFSRYIHHHKILLGNIFGLILKNKSFVGPLEEKVFWVEISNSQDMFISTKSTLGIFLTFKVK